MANNFKRGDVIIVDFNVGVGHEQSCTRPAVVISNNVANKHSPVLIVSPLSNKKPCLPTHLFIEERQTTILFEHIYTIDRSRVYRKSWHLPDKYITLMHKRLAYSLALPYYEHQKKGY